MIELLSLYGALTGIAVWGFWLGALVLTCLLIGLTENEHWGWSSVTFAVTFVALASLNIFNLYSFTIAHADKVLWDAGFYLLVGVVWGAVKWWRFCVERRRAYDAAKKAFLIDNNAVDLTPELRVKWTSLITGNERYNRYCGISAQAPDASDFKEKIINWMYMWPFSMLGTIFSDFIKKVWDSLYEWMGGIYKTIAKSVWKGTENDLASDKEMGLSQTNRVKKAWD